MSYHNYEQKIANLEEEIERLEGENRDYKELLEYIKTYGNFSKSAGLLLDKYKEPNEEN